MVAIGTAVPSRRTATAAAARTRSRLSAASRRGPRCRTTLSCSSVTAPIIAARCSGGVVDSRLVGRYRPFIARGRPVEARVPARSPSISVPAKHPERRTVVTFTVDPQVAAILAPMAEAMAAAPHPAVGDVASRRVALEAMMAETAALQATPADVTATDFHAVAGGGTKALLRWYAKDGAAPGSAALYLHGGGMILGSVALYDAPIARYVSASGVPMLAVDYRLAPEHPDPTPVEDVYTGLKWLHDHAAELGVDPARIAVMGDSAGGGLAAGVTLLARDRGGPAVARQILVFPMLDDRTTTPDPELVPFATWTYEDNV